MEINITKNGDTTICAIKGRIDTVVATELDEQMADLRQQDNIDLVVDMNEVSYISSSGLRCFISLFKAVTSHGGKMQLVHLKPEILEIFEITGFSKLFEIK